MKKHYLVATIILLMVVMTLKAEGTGDSFKTALRECQNEEILTKIQNGEPIEYSHLIIKGDLDLGKLNFQTNIAAPIRINDSIFEGSVNFDSVIFNETIILSGSNFTKSVDFEKATFKKGAYFEDVIFNEQAKFEKANFRGMTNFWGSSFCENANFLETTFNDDVFSSEVIFRKDADFRRTKFNNEAGFWNSTFGGYANFRGSIFSGSAYFPGSSFKDTADFSSSLFNSSAIFISNYFNSIANFKDIRYNDRLELQHSYFNDSADFGNSIFNGPTLFIGTIFNSTITFSGSDSSWSRISVGRYTYYWKSTDQRGSHFNDLADFHSAIFNDIADYRYSIFNGTTNFEDSSFQEMANFSGARFKSFLLGWGSLRDKFISNDKITYLNLIQNFKDHGQFREANQCYYKYRFENMNSIEDYISWLSCGFGVDWHFTILFGAAIIFIFGIIYFLSNKALTGNFIDSICFSLVVLLSVPKEFYLNKFEDYKNNKMITSLIILERLIGWGILVIFINTLSKVMLHI